MEIAVLAIKPVLKKLGDLLVGEFTLENRVRKGIESLITELTLMQAALEKVAKVPQEQLDKGVKIWAGKVKELSYQMEDIIDRFMIRLEDGGEPGNPKNKVKKLLKKTIKLFKNGRELHRISDALEEVMGQAKQLTELRLRYEQNIPEYGAVAKVDPRVMALYTDETELIGIEDTRDEIINMLTKGDNWSNHPLKTVSIVGFGGLGKTTLAKVVYDKIKGQFYCGAFVSVSQNPDMKKILKDILFELNKTKYAGIYNLIREEKQLIDELVEFLGNRRYLIVIDDIWDKEAWQLIKCAFSKNSLGSRLITTTRIISVAEACCSSSDDIYRMKPLSGDVSRRLFYKRVFPQEKNCPWKLVQLFEDILKKCGGIPLAIITTASLVASNHQIKIKDQWYVLLDSIDCGLAEDHNMDKMKKILLFSYYDLPFYLKPCLLYLSIFPEDHKIIRSKLIWRWISEGLVYSRNQETSLYELGDSYFNELVNRSMIQPIGIDDEEKVEACRVHDMVLDLIRSLATEENFVTILDDTKRKLTSLQNKIRRLSIQSCNVDVTTSSMAQLRSFAIFTDNSVYQVLNISSFQFLRVLDLEGCNISDIRYVRNLLHLRFIGLRYTDIKELPVEIGKLQFLQTLDIRKTQIKELPPSVIRLRHLMCLLVGHTVKFPSGIGNLTSLEVLEMLDLHQLSSHNLNLHVVKELGYLTKLRVLRVFWEYDLDESMCKVLVESLNHLRKLEILDIHSDSKHVDLMREGWEPPRQLRQLSIHFGICNQFLALPAWINPSSLPLLSRLTISVNKARPEEIQLIGMLPALRYLSLEDTAKSSTEGIVERLVFTADAFPCLTECHLYMDIAVASVFPRGAAPRLRCLWFSSPAVWIARGDFDLGLRHLPSLQIVYVSLRSLEASDRCLKASDRDVHEARAALNNVAEGHPNSFGLCISGFSW